MLRGVGAEIAAGRISENTSSQASGLQNRAPGWQERVPYFPSLILYNRRGGGARMPYIKY